MPYAKMQLSTALRVLVGSFPSQECISTLYVRAANIPETAIEP
jgi:hypothetical protein